MWQVVLGLLVLTSVLTGCASHPTHPAAPDLASILGGILSQGDDTQPDYEPPHVPFTEPTILLTNHDGWDVEDIEVPTEPGMAPYICFEVKGERPIECLYKALKGSEVKMVWVLPKKEKT